MKLGHSRDYSKRQIKNPDDVQGPPRAGGKDVYVMFPAAATFASAGLITDFGRRWEL